MRRKRCVILTYTTICYTTRCYFKWARLLGHTVLLNVRKYLLLVEMAKLHRTKSKIIQSVNEYVPSGKNTFMVGLGIWIWNDWKTRPLKNFGWKNTPHIEVVALPPPLNLFLIASPAKVWVGLRFYSTKRDFCFCFLINWNLYQQNTITAPIWTPKAGWPKNIDVKRED